MNTLKSLTMLQWMGIILIGNGVITGSVNEMTDLLGAVWAHHLVSVATMGSGFVGGVIMMFGGQTSMVKQVAAMPGVQSITVNSEANKTLAQIAVSEAADSQKVEATPGSASLVAAIAKSGV